MSLTATVTKTTEVKLDPALRRKLKLQLDTYAELVEQRQALDQAIKKASAEIGELRDETGELSIGLDGYKVTLVAGTFKRFNPKKFVSLGGDLALYEQAVEEHPKKPFNRITLPGDKAEEAAE